MGQRHPSGLDDHQHVRQQGRHDPQITPTREFDDRLRLVRGAMANGFFEGYQRFSRHAPATPVAVEPARD